MKYAKWMVVMTLMMLPGLAAAQLARDQKIVTQVPFEFMVGNRFIPSGQCEVLWVPPNSGALMIRVPGKTAVFAHAWQDEIKSASGNYALVFKRYGDQYFLSGIKLADSKTTYRLPETRAEKELRAQNVPVAEEVLLASLK